MSEYDRPLYNFSLIDLMNVDTSGILALEELHKRLLSRGVQVSESAMNL